MMMIIFELLATKLLLLLLLLQFVIALTRPPVIYIFIKKNIKSWILILLSLPQRRWRRGFPGPIPACQRDISFMLNKCKQRKQLMNIAARRGCFQPSSRSRPRSVASKCAVIGSERLRALCRCLWDSGEDQILENIFLRPGVSCSVRPPHSYPISHSFQVAVL